MECFGGGWLPHQSGSKRRAKTDKRKRRHQLEKRFSRTRTTSAEATATVEGVGNLDKLDIVGLYKASLATPRALTVGR